MGLLAKIADSFRNASPIGPTSLARVPSSSLVTRGLYDPARVPEWQSQQADWSPWDDTAKLADAVRKCTVVWACATYLADAVAESPLEVYKTAGSETDVADDRVANLVRDLLANPNPATSGSEFLLTLVLGQCVWGYGVVEKVRMAGNLALPVELWTLRPDWLQRRQRGTTGERYYTYPKPSGATREIEERDLLMVPYYPDPWRSSYGISPAQVAAREIGIDVALTDFLKVFLDAGGIPPFVLTHPDPIYDPATITAMQELWRQKYGGQKAYGNLPVLHGGYDIKPVGTTVNEMAWPDLRALTEQKIAQAHRVPLELIQGQMAQTGGPLTSTQFDGAMAVLQRYGAAPLRSRIDAVFSRGVLAEFTGGDPTYELAFDTSAILALQEDHDALHARVRADVGGVPLMTLNEGRRELGLDELPGGDVFAIPFSITLTPIAELVAAPTTTTTTTPPPVLPPVVPAKSTRVYRDVKILTAGALETRASALARTRKDRARLTEIGTRALRKFWVEQGARITATITGKSAEPFTVRVSVPGGQLIAWPQEEVELAKVLLRFYHLSGETAFANVSGTLGISLDWTLSNPNVQRVVHDLGRRIVAISEQTRIDVTETIDAALSEGVSMPQLAERLSSLFTETYPNRAIVVARTESAAAYNRASVLGYHESGQVDEVELADNEEHDTDPLPPTMTTCADRAGLVVPLAEANDYNASMHPQCVMAVVPIVNAGA